MEKIIKEIERLVRDLSNEEIRTIDLTSIATLLQQIAKLEEDEIIIVWDLYLLTIKKIHSNISHDFRECYGGNTEQARNVRTIKRREIKEMNEYFVKIAIAFISRMNVLSRKNDALADLYEIQVETACKQVFNADNNFYGGISDLIKNAINN